MLNVTARSGKKIDSEVISAFEKTSNIKFPDEYIDLIMDHDGGWISPSDIVIVDPEAGEEVFSCSLLLSFSRGEMQSYASGEIDNLPESVVLFATTGGSPAFGFDYRQRKENPPVVLWLPENTEPNRIVIADESFSKFLSKLQNVD